MTTSIGPGAAIADGVVQQVPDDMRDHDLVGTVGRGVARAEERILTPG